MTTRWRYLESDGVSAVGGLAFDEAMMLHFGRDAGRATGAPCDAALRLYTYQPHCALVGRYQSVDDEIDVDYCAENGIQVGRRPTGGGAIIMGPGQLGVAIAAPAPIDEQPREVLRRYARGVVAGLAEIGIQAGFRSKNDLEVGGRKIAGLGLYRDNRGALLFHASVLVDLDVELMLAALRIPGAKISDKGVARVSERVTTVSAELGERLTARDVRRGFADSLARAFGAELSSSELDQAERKREAELVRARYGDETWVFQRSSRQDIDGSAMLKGSEGLLRVHVGLHGDVIKNVLLVGDFNVMPTGVTRLESALKWCRASPEAITRAALEALSPDDLGVSPRLVAQAIWKAILNAQRHQRRSHPRRAAGSCYFPEVQTRTQIEESTT